MNKFEEEKTDFAFPSTTAFEPREAALRRKFRKIVEGSGIPEIIWGVKTEGNHASSEEQRDTFVKYVEAKREQLTGPYTDLFNISIRLMSLAGEIANIPEIEIKWNELSAISEETKAKIFESFAKGVNSLVSSAGFTKEQLFKLWVDMYPSATENDVEEFIIGLSKMAAHNQYKNSDYMQVMGLLGTPEDDDVELPDDESGV
jgi:hypothetical protein